MQNATKWWHNRSLGCVACICLGLSAATATAQTAPPDPAVAVEPAPPTVTTPPPAAPAEVVAPAVVTPPQTTIPETVPPPPPAAPPPAAVVEPPPPPPPAEDATKSPITMNAWLRLGHMLHDFEEPESLGKLTQDAEIDILLNATIIEQVMLTANFVGTYSATFADEAYGGSIAGDLAIMDLIAQFNLDDAFHVWVGRMLVPSDRSNFSGPWFMAPWSYPGFFQKFAAPLGPHQGPFGRNDGVTVWGQAAGGVFKYYAGAFELYNAGANPLFSGRLSIHLINPEPGFYGNSTFYGTKDVFSIGIGAQAQAGGSGGDDFMEYNADVLFEKNFGKAGVLDIEGAIYKYEGDGEAIDYSYFALASYILPGELGPGQVQPLVRLQQAKPTDSEADTWTLVDAQIGYIVSSFACRFALGYQYSNVDGVNGNAVLLGIQLQK
jgi:hypothetical protein